MRLLEELLKEFEAKTNIQKEEHLTKLIGIEVKIVGEIGDIHTQLIQLQNIIPALSDNNSIRIDYEGNQLRQHLLEYSNGDGVELITRLTGAQFGYSDCYILELLSSRKLITRDAKEKVTSMQNEIHSLQSIANELNSNKEQAQKELVVLIIITMISLIIAIVSYYFGIVHWDGGLFTGLFMQGLLIISGIATIGCVFSMISGMLKVSSLKSEIGRREETIRTLESDINILRLHGGKKNSR